MKKNRNIYIPVAKPTVDIREANLAYKQIKSGWITMGKKVKEFENKVCKFLNVKYAIAMNNGTSTLDALLTALNITAKDEVIIPSLTYISTANVVMYKGAKLVLCDNDIKTFNVSPNSVLKKITKKTKLIIVTDLKGMPVEYDFFKKLSKKNIWVKRPGTGYFPAHKYYKLIGKKAKRFIKSDNFISKRDV